MPGMKWYKGMLPGTAKQTAQFVPRPVKNHLKLTLKAMSYPVKHSAISESAGYWNHLISLTQFSQKANDLIHIFVQLSCLAFRIFCFFSFRSLFSSRCTLFSSFFRRCLGFFDFEWCMCFESFFGANSGPSAFDGSVAGVDFTPVISSLSEDSSSGPEPEFASASDGCFDDCSDCSAFFASIDALSCARAFSFAFCSFRSVSILSFPAWKIESVFATVQILCEYLQDHVW